MMVDLYMELQQNPLYSDALRLNFGIGYPF